jgi:hypothetical protein
MSMTVEVNAEEKTDHGGSMQVQSLLLFGSEAQYNVTLQR